MATTKIKCPVKGCGHEGHILYKHLRDVHKIKKPDAIKQYGEEKCVSQHGKNTKAKESGFMPMMAERKKKKFEIGATFGLDLGWEYEVGADGTPLTDASGDPKVKKDKSGRRVKAKRYVTGFEEPGPMAPPLDDQYVFHHQATIEALMCLEEGMFTYTFGPTGSGKTSLWQQIAARLNFNAVRFSCHRQVTTDASLGQWAVKGKEMYWIPGKVYKAYHMPGTILILDEFDAQNEDHAMIFQRPLEMMDGVLECTNGEDLERPQDFFIGATANTQGMGDRSGLYAAGTTVLNFANLSRFAYYLTVDYPIQADEVKILMSRFESEGLEKDEAKAMIKAAAKVREAFVQGEVSQPVTPRDTQMWAKAYMLLLDMKQSAEGAFVRRFPEDEAEAVRGIVQRAVDKLS